MGIYPAAAFVCFLATLPTAAGASTLAPPWAGNVPAKERHPCLFFGPEDLSRTKARLEREPYRMWWGGRRGSGEAVALAFRWLVEGDEAAAARARENLL